MEKYITPVSIANSIMLDKTYSNYYVLVEGAKDSKLFRKFFNKEQVRIKETFGCDKLHECLSILEEREHERIFGIIDRDFHEILRTIPQKENIFVVDHHDIEIMMMNSKAFEHVLNIFTTQEKIARFEADKEKNLLDLIFELGSKIGYLKLANKIYSLGLVFKPKEVDGNQIAYHKFISSNLDFEGLEVMVDKIIDYSRNKSAAIKDKKEIIDRYNELIKKNYDINQLSNGHDISNILFLFLKKVVCSSNKMLVNFNSIEDSLILAYDINEFQKTNLYMDIKKFANNKGTDFF